MEPTTPALDSLAFAFLTEDRIHVAKEGTSRPFRSKFGDEIVDRTLRAGRKNAWKSQGTGARFMQGPVSTQEEMAVAPARLTALARGGRGLIYSLDTDSVSALLELDPENGEEKRLFHSNEIRLDSFSPSPDGKLIACAVRNTYGVLDLALLDVEKGGLQELTEGDSADSHPSYREDLPNRLVFQSAGLARDEEGWVMDRGPSSIESLNLDHGEMQTLVEDPERDLLVPRVDGEGRLYYIRRPYKRPSGPKPFETLKAILLFPFHLAFALFHLVSSLTAFISKKPLLDTQGGKRPRSSHIGKRIQILGEMVEIGERRGRKHSAGDEDGSLVPATWQLVRHASADRADDEPEVLASGVVAFDLLPEGELLYSNGSAVFHLDRQGHRHRLLKERRIRQLTHLDPA